MLARASFGWWKNIFIYKNKLRDIPYINNIEIHLLIRKKVILAPFYELVNENCNTNRDILNLNEIINATEKENTDVDDHHVKMTNYKLGREN